MPLIPLERSIIPACDVDLDTFTRLVETTHDMTIIGAYKIGFQLALSVGLPTVVSTARRFTNKPLIYDHQKGGTDVPHTGKAYMKVLKEAGINSAILFPLSRGKTLEAWLEAAKEEGIHPIVGRAMTHERFTLETWNGKKKCNVVRDTHNKAARLGVTDFVVPSNHIDLIRYVHQAASPIVMSTSSVPPTYYSPGLLSQGGTIEGLLDVLPLPCPVHAIVGRAIYESIDPRAVISDLASRL